MAGKIQNGPSWEFRKRESKERYAWNAITLEGVNGLPCITSLPRKRTTVPLAESFTGLLLCNGTLLSSPLFQYLHLEQLTTKLLSLRSAFLLPTYLSSSSKHTNAILSPQLQPSNILPHCITSN